jgi:uncharacterized protein (DUF1501 family)
MRLSRRAFLKSGGLAMVSYGLDPLFLARAVYADQGSRPPARSGRVLVCLFQRGAVDGLSMLVPHGDAHYYTERPKIAIPKASVVDLDGRFGLHPALAPLKPLWDAGVLAPIHAIGSPEPTRSHFDAQDYMESGTPGVKSTPDGWLNRYCQHQREHDETPFRAVSFGPELPRILSGSAPSLAIGDLRAFGLRAPNDAIRDRLTRAFERLYETAPTGCSRRRPRRASRPRTCSAASSPIATSPSTARAIRTAGSGSRSDRSRSSSRPAWASRSRSPT